MDVDGIYSLGHEQVTHNQRRKRARSAEFSTSPVYIGMKNYCLLSKQLNPTPTIARSLEEGLYYPDWRHRVVELYLPQVFKADDPSEKLPEIYVREPDDTVLEYLLFQLSGVANSAIKYAVGCRTGNGSDRRASKIKAMVLSKRSSEDIANELGTEPLNILVFEELFFDARRFLSNRSWVREVCFPPIGPYPSLEAELEARWFQAAYYNGWDGLQSVMFGKFPVDPTFKKWPTAYCESARMGFDRVADYTRHLQVSGAAPSEEDLRLLSILADLEEFAGKMPFWQDSNSESTPTLPLSNEQHFAKIDPLLKLVLRVNEALVETLVDPSPSRFEKFLEQPIFEQASEKKARDPGKSVEEQLQATLKEAIPILKSQVEKLQERFFEFHAKVQAKIQSKPQAGVDTSFPLNAARGEVRIDWQTVLAAVRQRFDRWCEIEASGPSVSFTFKSDQTGVSDPSPATGQDATAG